jgi:hypothetical protein
VQIPCQDVAFELDPWLNGQSEALSQILCHHTIASPNVIQDWNDHIARMRDKGKKTDLEQLGIMRTPPLLDTVSCQIVPGVGRIYHNRTSGGNEESQS